MLSICSLKMPSRWWLPLCLSVWLSACGGAGESVSPAQVPVATAVTETVLAPAADPVSPAVFSLLSAPVQLSAPAQRSAMVGVAATTDPGVLLLLMPDGYNPDDPLLRSWLDAASEVGVRIQPLSDSAFLQMGPQALAYAGLILPDSLHVMATDALIAAIRSYTEGGGKTMLVYDFGALTLLGSVPVYPVPKSRLSDLAGVDYVLYEQLRDRTTGLGPVTALRSTMRALLVPPGKSLPFTGLPQATAISGAVETGTSTMGSNTPSSSGVLNAGGVSRQSALYLPLSKQDPGGARGFDPQQYSDVRYASSRPGSAKSVPLNFGQAIRAQPVDKVTSVQALSPVPGSMDTLAVEDPLDVYSGYLLGALIYPSFVTQGSFGSAQGQQALAMSPQFGLVAGVNPVGAGQVLFVNLPLTYLKGRTDALMMHGFLHYFTRQMLQLPHLSAMPGGVGGMTLDWHLDAKEAQAPTQKLINLKVFSDPAALFSIEMTAGPDVVVASDRLGWNLAGNKTAQQMLKNFSKQGHAVGSHGGWIHDFYGLQVTEDNALTSTGGACRHAITREDNFMQCLVLNRQDVDAVTGVAGRSYSAPEGNNPRWAMNWLAQKGVVATYFGGHTGLGATRQWREGQLLNPQIWVFPVTPQGLYATFEEFQDYGVPQADVLAWYKALINFSVAQNTSRLVYAHPPGAAQWSQVLTDMLAYAKSRRPRFAWYTMTRLADFSAQRLSVSWSQTLDVGTGQTVFNATHPLSLKDMTWRLPKSRFSSAPSIVSGNAVVDSSDGTYWLVKANGGTQLVFRAL